MSRVVSLFLAGILGILSADGVLAEASASGATLYELAEKEGSATLVLHLKAPPRYEVRRTEKGVVLNFARPLELPDLSPVAKRLNRWLQNIWAGYDALLLKLQPGVDLQMNASGKDLVIQFKGDGEAQRKAGSVSTYPLERVEVLLLLKSGEVLEAQRRFAELVERYPGKIQPLLDLSGAEERLGRWRQALDAYERALRISPDNREIAKARTRLLREYGTQAAVGASYVKVGSDEKQRLARLKGRYLSDNGLLLSMEYELRDAEVDRSIRRVDGSLQPFDGRRHNLALRMEHSLGMGEQRFSLYAGAKEVGIGWRYSWPGDDSRSDVSLEWHRPWYETPEALAGYGTRDRLAFHHERRLRQPVTVSGGISYNRYGLDGLRDAARSVRLQGGVRYQWSMEKPELSFGYNLDWENIMEHSERIDGSGGHFFPLPLEDREQHTLDAVWRDRLSEHFTLGAQIGFEYDRRRDARAPFGRLQLDYEANADFAAALNLETGLSSYRGGDDSFYRIGGDLKWRF
ncbi:MAG TPA: tetratricopeptide repeat protein [Chromatiales bacterium]|nr:tetratricopeptide repeat protein [Chromatiales bacterium]